MNEPETIARLLTETDVWAVVGASPDPRRDSHQIARLLQDRGKRIVPVNPEAETVLGEQAYPDLASVPDDIDIDVVDIFRRPDRAGTHVDEAIARGVPAVWLQLGVVDRAAAARAEAAGLAVVMDRCPKIEYPRLGR